ncbi:MAG: pitrilysin family protein [Gemmataceae bacterium]
MTAGRTLFALVLLVTGRAFAADPAIDPKLIRTANGPLDAVRTHTLPNGLRVYLVPVPGAPVVSTMVAYKVGAADEDKGQTGLSHYLEHLLFKGTDKLVPGDIDRATQRNGGRNNAYTSEDMTVYHFDFAADRWEQALRIEADRMRNTRIDPKHEFEQEKGAVVAELKGGEDRPWELEYKAILPLLFPKAHPYSHPVIGDEQHVRGATAEIITRYYDKWYHPNNASVVISGGFDPDRALKLVTELFGPIPKAELPPRPTATPIPARVGLVRKELPSKFDVPRLTLGFNGVASADPDTYALDLIERLLADGKTARLYKVLVEQERIAGGVSASNSAGRYPGWFSVQVELLQGKDRATAEKLVFAELAKLAKEPVGDTELARAKRKAVARTVFAREDVHSLADSIAQAVTRTDLDHLKGYLDKLIAVTPADIQRVAGKYLKQDTAVAVWSVPQEDKGGKSGSQPGKPSRVQRSADAPAGGFKLTDARRVKLPNGLTLLMLANPRLPVLAVDAFVANVRLREPAHKNGVAALVGQLLDEGTPTRTGEQIASLIEDTGGSLSLGSSGGSLKVLSSDADLGLALLFDCLAHPSFPADALERKREQQLSEIADAETQPQTRARQLFAATVYGNHPFGRPAIGKKAVVEKLTAADCRAFHAATFGPDETTVVAVGDFDPDKLAKTVEKLTAGWKPVKAAKPTPLAPPTPTGTTVKIISDPAAAQTHVFIGHLGITRNDPDYYALLVMDNVLGTGPGFTDRLSASLRDRQGLAYTVNAAITPSAAEQPGTFTGYIGTFPDKFLWVKDGFLKEIARIRDEPPTAQEVEDAKQYLLGSLPFRVATSDDVATQLLAAERFGLGLDFLDTYRKQVAAVTPAAVQAVARKHLHPNRLAVVAVGPIGPDGQPLTAPKK